MLHRFLGGACFLMLLVPLTLQGQQAQEAEEQEEEQQRPTLVVSQWKCDWQHMGEIVEGFESVTIPVWRDMQEEGLLLNAGIFIHEWGDEWNFNVFRIASDRDAFFDAFEEEGPRVQERLGELNISSETPSPLSQHCTDHRDNIYTLGPTIMDEQNE